MRGLAGKRAIVTGGVSGIGRAVVQRLMSEGTRVAIMDYDGDGCAKVQAEHPEIVVQHTDVTDADAVEAAMENIYRSFGGLDVLFNNAGISGPARVLETAPHKWRQTFSVNVDGVFHCAKSAARRMKSGGVILNMGSVSGIVAIPGYADYNASKAAVIQFTRTLALELAPDIRVNSISPGYVLTPMQRAEYTEQEIAALNTRIPMKRHAQPAEIAALVAFLASDETPFMTGANLVVDGGESAGGTASLCGNQET